MHIGRQIRPKLYDFWARRPEPLVPRNLRFEVTERIYSDGQVLEELNEESVKTTIQKIKEEGVESVALCLLHSYKNPGHEKRIKKMTLKKYPDIYISISSEVVPEFREYERMSTTVINAYVMPAVERYITDLRGKLREKGTKSDLYIMQSNGGVITAETAMEKSVATILSGPAGGVLGGQFLANLVNRKDLMTVDMGGTSFDMCLLSKGVPEYTTEREIGGYPIKLPMINVETIGAGGGSIAWIDKGGALRVGPQSAGAVPGPACYGHGGTEPTVTDANLVLGRLGPESCLSGEMKLDVDKAIETIQNEIATPLNLSVEKAAKGIIDVVNANMVRGMRRISVERGYDVRNFSLVAFGGAGPLHAADLARDLNISEIVIPLTPGIFSAVGMLTADVRHDYVRTHVKEISSIDETNFNSIYVEMEKEATSQLAEESVPKENIVLIRSADMRYKGQGYELAVQIASGKLDQENILKLKDEFHREHERAYGYCIEGEEVELVNVRITALGKLPPPKFKKEELQSENPKESALKGYRDCLFEDKFVKTKVFGRARLNPGNKIEGPAIIEQHDSTTVIHPGQAAVVDEYRNILIRENRASGNH